MICTIFLINFLIGSIFAESRHLTEDHVIFYHENGTDNVKLYWITKSWPDDLKGFSIKKRIRGGKWQDINISPINPELSANNSLENVLEEESYRNRLTRKRDSLISKGAIKIINKNEYLEKLKFSDNLKLLSYMFENDYDKALMSGFGLIDFMPCIGVCEYGLFPVYADGLASEPIKTIINDSNQNSQFKLSIIPEVLDKGDHVVLKVNLDSLELAERPIINGIKIYHLKTDKREVLTPYKILLSRNTGKNHVNYVVQNINRDSVYRFQFVPVNMFGTEGEPVQLIFDPQNRSGKSSLHLNEPELFQKNGKMGYTLSWNTENLGKDSLIGFIITEGWYKDTKVISDTLNAETGSYEIVINNDTTSSTNYRFRVMAVRSGSLIPLYSNEVTAVKSTLEPKLPLIDIEVEMDNRSQPVIMYLSWSENDLSDRFGIFSLERDGPVLEAVIQSSTIAELEIHKPLGGINYYQVMQLDAYDRILNVSDTVKIEIPSQHIPPVYIEEISQNESEIKLQWKAPVPMPFDLAGYELFVDGKVVLDQTIINKDVIECYLNLDQPGNHHLSLVAVSKGGIRSKNDFRPVMLKIDK